MEVLYDQTPDMRAAQDAACDTGLRLVGSVLEAAREADVYRVLREEPYDGNDQREALEHLRGVAHDHMDWRKGGQRDSVTVPKLPRAKVEMIETLGGMMDMTEAKIPEGRADLVIVLGSYKPNISDRADVADKVIGHQLIAYPGHRPIVAGFSSKRRMSEGDALEGEDFAPGAVFEIDCMRAALGRRLTQHGLGRPMRFADLRRDRREAAAWEVEYYEADAPKEFGEGTLDVVTLAAPPQPGTARATTVDTYQFAAEFFGPEMLAGKTAVLATAALYAPYMRMSALRMLGIPNGMDVQMATYVTPQFLEPHRLGQEYTAAVDHALLLVDAIRAFRERSRLTE